MRVNAKDLYGKKFSGIISEPDLEAVEKLNDTFLPEREIKRIIDNLNISPEAKNLLEKISATTIQVGEKLLNVGKRILSLVCKLFKEYPKVTFGVIIGVVVTKVTALVPVLGFLLAPFSPLIIVAFALTGLWEDIQDHRLKREIDRKTLEFECLKTR